MPLPSPCVDCVSSLDRPFKKRKGVGRETVKFIVCDFEDVGKYIKPPIVYALGREWIIEVFPQGHEGWRPFVSCSLHLCKSPWEHCNTIATVSLHCKASEETISGPSGWHFANFARRQTVLDDFLEDDGSLVIELDIQIGEVWGPYEPEYQDIASALYQDGSSETSDVAFLVEGKVYRAHKDVLAIRCKTLNEIVTEGKSSNKEPIPILSIRGDIFKAMLDFVYTVKVPSINTKEEVVELLLAADRFGCVSLKLFTESWIVNSFLGARNATELFILADSHSCALLKESAMKWIVADPKSARSTEAWSQIRESPKLMDELFDSLANTSAPYMEESCADEVEQLDVTTLREELDYAHLELDGSREALVQRLKTHRRQQDSVSESLDASSEGISRSFI